MDSTTLCIASYAATRCKNEEAKLGRGLNGRISKHEGLRGGGVLGKKQQAISPSPPRDLEELCKFPSIYKIFGALLCTQDELSWWTKLYLQLYHFTCFYRTVHANATYDFMPIKSKKNNCIRNRETLLLVQCS